MITKHLTSLLLLLSAFLPGFARQEEVMTMTVISKTGETSDFPLEEISEVEFATKIPEQSESYVSPLAGKKIGYNGDSLIESRYYEEWSNGGGAAALICSMTGAKAENRAVGGATMARTSGGRHNVVADIVNMSDDLDLICFDGGLNDYWIGIPLGQMSGKTDFSGELDETTFIGALESVFRQAIAKWEGKPIVYIIPHKVYGAYGTYNKNGKTYTSFIDAAREVCEKYGVPYIDGEKIFILNGLLPLHKELFFCNNDGQHPNEQGYRRYWVGPMISLFTALLP